MQGRSLSGLVSTRTRLLRVRFAAVVCCVGPPRLWATVWPFEHLEIPQPRIPELTPPEKRVLLRPRQPQLPPTVALHPASTDLQTSTLPHSHLTHSTKASRLACDLGAAPHPAFTVTSHRSNEW